MSNDTSDLFDQWFRIADADRDGRVSGPEAVTFFQRSRLPQETLFKVLVPSVADWDDTLHLYFAPTSAERGVNYADLEIGRRR